MGPIMGGVLGGVAFVSLAVFSLVCWYRRRRRRRIAPSTAYMKAMDNGLLSPPIVTVPSRYSSFSNTSGSLVRFPVVFDCESMD